MGHEKAALLVLALVLPASSVPWRGVDMSQLSTEDAGGSRPPFRRAANSTSTIDALALLSASGANAFRMRMWNDPCAGGRCDPAAYAYANLTGVLAMARRCQAHGLAFILDLHYSDWWADPGHQTKPAAWTSLTYVGLAKAVYNFTRATVAALVDQGTPPRAVQIGNEISNGFLWNGRGQPCAQGGRLWCGGGGQPAAQFARLAGLVAEGIRGVRDACDAGTCAVAIHTDLGNHIQTDGIGFVEAWYQNLTRALGSPRRETLAALSFDLIGLSMYPVWDGGKTMQNVATLGALARAFPRRQIYIAETAYPAAGAARPEKDFPPTPAGQLAFLLAVQNAVANVLPPAQNGGLLWWEGTENGWNSLFDAHFVARPALLRGFRPQRK